MSWLEEVEEIRRRRETALGMGGPEGIARQHKRGRLTIRERLDALLDPGSFVEVGALSGSTRYEHGKLEEFVPEPLVAGLGQIAGRDIAVAGADFTIRGGTGRGATDSSFRTKREFLERMAHDYRIPYVNLIDAAGASVESVEHMGRTYLPNSRDWSSQLEMLGLVPMVTAVLGSVAGGPAAFVLLSHFSCMVEGTELFAAGPAVVKRAIGLEISKSALGGIDVQVRQSGVVDNPAVDELDCFAQIRRFLSYMPRNVWELPPYEAPQDSPDRRSEELLSIVPRERKRAYDMRRLVSLVVDEGSFFETRPLYGRCVITGFARMNGHVVGVLASNPLVQGGALDVPGAEKMARFIEICDTFHMPLVNFVDVPGFMIGPQAEAAGTLRSGMRAMWLAHQANVPVVTIHVRRCYGMAGVASSTPARLGLRLAWPSGEWGSLPIEGGVDAAFRREIETAPDPALRRQELEERLQAMRSPFPTAEAFGVEDLIDPRETRPLVIRYLDTAIPAITHDLGPRPRYGVRP